jgi:hypothetical protein
MRNFTVFSIKACKEFFKLLYRRVKILSYITSFLLVIIGIALIYFGYSGYVYIISGCGIIIFSLSVIGFIENEYIKRNKLLIHGAAQQYEFYEDYFTIHQISKLGDLYDKYFYKEVLSVYKGKQYYFIFITRKNAFIVDISGFDSNDEEKIDELFKNTFNKSFINKSHRRNKY